MGEARDGREREGGNGKRFRDLLVKSIPWKGWEGSFERNLPPPPELQLSQAKIPRLLS